MSWRAQRDQQIFCQQLMRMMYSGGSGAGSWGQQPGAGKGKGKGTEAAKGKSKGKGQQTGKGGKDGTGKGGGRAWGQANSEHRWSLSQTEPETTPDAAMLTAPWICLSCETVHDRAAKTTCRSCKAPRFPKKPREMDLDDTNKSGYAKVELLVNRYVALQEEDLGGKNVDMTKDDDEADRFEAPKKSLARNIR